MNSCFRCQFLKKAKDQTCPACKGTNCLNGVHYKCFFCDGEGLEYAYPNRFGTYKTCHVCKGQGALTMDMIKCTGCNGMGMVCGIDGKSKVNCGKCGGKNGIMRNDKGGNVPLNPVQGLQQPGMQNLGIQQPIMQLPGMQIPGIQQPRMPMPNYQQPFMQQPGMQIPVIQQPRMPMPNMQIPSIQEPRMQIPIMQQQQQFNQMQGYPQPGYIPQVNPQLQFVQNYQIPVANHPNFSQPQPQPQPQQINQAQSSSSTISQIHLHPLTQGMIKECKACERIQGPGYNCHVCSQFSICTDCHTKVLSNPPNTIVHSQHPLVSSAPKSEWRCQVCYSYYKNKISFHCSKCNFDCCFNCYYYKPKPQATVIQQEQEQQIAQDEPEEDEDNDDEEQKKKGKKFPLNTGKTLSFFHKHPLKKKPIEECKICDKNSCKGYLCSDCCDFGICNDCFILLINGEKNTNNHEYDHTLKTKIREKWDCNLCGNTFEKKAAFYCGECDWGCCVRCYFV